MKNISYFLPKIAKELLVTYTGSEIAVSAICPAQKQNINVAFIMHSGNTYPSQTEIEVPELCITHLVAKDKYLLNHHQNGLFSKYVMANVYDYGVICFGDVIHKVPHDLRQAWNYYWASAFNQENSDYDDYHRNNCVGVKVHSYAGHKELDSCICACCIEICNCECYCNQIRVFNDYLRTYGKHGVQLRTNETIINSSTIRFNLASNHLIILPYTFKTNLGLSDYKYPDIFAFVTSEEPTEYRCLVGTSEVSIPKDWISNGNSKPDSGIQNVRETQV